MTLKKILETHDTTKMAIRLMYQDEAKKLANHEKQPEYRVMSVKFGNLDIQKQWILKVRRKSLS